MSGVITSMFPPASQALLSEVEINTLATLMLPGVKHSQPPSGVVNKVKQSAVTAFFDGQSDGTPATTEDAVPQFSADSGYQPVTHNTLPVPAGYTYLCQFIAHDIVADSHFHVDGRITRALLNLDSMYGNTGAQCPLNSFENAYFEPHSGRFITGDKDVHRVAPGSVDNAPWATAFMPEQRNDENVIVLQLHRLFQGLHNALTDRLTGTSSSAQRILTARRYTLAIFHHMVINDLLPKLVLEKCHHYFFKQHGPFYYSDSHRFTELPAEFKLASFRFGHSMLRPRYHLKTENAPSFSLDEIMRRPPFKPLQAEHYIDWPALFFDPQENDGLHQIARPIDLFITTDMATVPHPTNPKAGRNIAQLNLLAGIKVKLNSAEAILEQIQSEPHFASFANHFAKELVNRKLPTASPGQETDFIYALMAVLQEQQRTPLWLYTMQENLLDYPGSNQFKLGLIASAINCDVLRSAIYECYRNNGQENLTELATNLTTTINQAFACAGKPLNTMADITAFLSTRSNSDD